MTRDYLRNCLLWTTAMAAAWLLSHSVLLAKEPSPASAGEQLVWHTDYDEAYRSARRQKRMLLIHFIPEQETHTQRSLEQYLRDDQAVREKLAAFELARLSVDATIKRGEQDIRLLEHPGFAHLQRQPGIAMVDLANQDQPYYGQVVTCLPYGSGKYYRWRNSHLAVALDLPPGTITQRTMVWAVRTHPERPQSTTGHASPELAAAAEQHSEHQASIGVQGHHRWETRFHQIRSRVGAGSASEVVAESWPNQNLIDSCIDCVQSWRHSSGHWRAVRSRHRLFGYDICRGRNGIWYGTGIFAN